MNYHYDPIKASAANNSASNNSAITFFSTFWHQRIVPLWFRLMTRRATNETLRSRGFYRRFDGKDVLDASYSLTTDGRWYGRLRLNNWTVKETYKDTQEEINEWCFQAFSELHTVGYADEEVAVVRR